MRLGLIGAIVICMLAFQGTRQPEQGISQGKSSFRTQQPTASEQNPNDAKDDAIERLILQIQSQQQRESTERQDATSQTQQNTEIQWKLVRYTRALVGVGVLQAIVLLLTVVVIYLQVQTTRNSERAWIVVNVMGQFTPTNLGEGAIWLVSPNVINKGRTPARIVKMALNLNPVPRGNKLPLEPIYRNEYSWNVVHPPEQSFQPLNEAVVRSDLLRASGGEIRLYLCGFIRYRDAWNRPKETRFCFLYHHGTRTDEARSGFYMDPEAPEPYTRCT